MSVQGNLDSLLMTYAIWKWITNNIYKWSNSWILPFLSNLYSCHHIHVNNIETLDAFEGFFALYIKRYKVKINERIFGLSTKAETSEN